MTRGSTARTVLSGLALVVAWGSVVEPGAAQLVKIRGRVLDRVTRAPVEGAFVGPAGLERGVLTDSLGAFALEMRTDYAYALSIENLGYENLTVSLAESAPEEFTTVLLRPDPVALQGLTVLVDRFERRRRTYFGSVRVLDQDRLLRDPSESAFTVVRRAVPLARQCRTRFEDLCTWRRGRDQVVQVCIDERPAFAGAQELEGYDSKELYLVEVYGWGQTVRVYTRWYVERLLDEGRGLRPLAWGC